MEKHNELPVMITVRLQRELADRLKRDAGEHFRSRSAEVQAVLADHYRDPSDTRKVRER